MYNSVTMTGTGIDWNGTWHPNPGDPSATDPFQYMQQRDYNTAEWANGIIPPTNAQNGDPMYLLYNNYQ